MFNGHKLPSEMAHSARIQPVTNAELLMSISHIARQAGDLILQVYATDFRTVDKADASPVTQADQRAEVVILAGLFGHGGYVRRQGREPGEDDHFRALIGLCHR
jgi:fructose-1,6-bisphosphatase/inositol monophosphatase family enzyme